MPTRDIPFEIIHLILFHLDYGDNQGYEYLEYFKVSRAFWEVSRTFFFRKITVRLQRERAGHYELLLQLLQQQDYPILPLIRNVQLILDGFGPITHEKLDSTFLHLMTVISKARLFTFSLKFNGYPWHDLPPPLKKCVERMVRSPTLDTLVIHFAPKLPVDLFKSLKITQLELSFCSADPLDQTKLSLPAMPLKSLTTDHSFQLLSIYSENIFPTTEDEPIAEAFTGLVRYESYSKMPPQQLIYAQRSLQTLQEIVLTLEDVQIPPSSSLDLGLFPHLRTLSIDYMRYADDGDTPPSDLPSFCETFLRPSKVLKLLHLSLRIFVRDNLDDYVCVSPIMKPFWHTLDVALAHPNFSHSHINLELCYVIIHENCSLHDDYLQPQLESLVFPNLPLTSLKQKLQVVISPMQLNDTNVTIPIFWANHSQYMQDVL